MELFSNLLLSVGSISAAVYCFVLGRRLRRFGNVGEGIGGVIEKLSLQVDEMNQAINEARVSAENASSKLEDTTFRAEGAAKRLELLIAALHDLPSEGNLNDSDTPMVSGSSLCFLRSSK